MSWLFSCIGCGSKKVVEKEETKLLDFQHCSLSLVPPYIFECERFLEELYLDSNQISELPRELFLCHELQILFLSDNDLRNIPAAISSLNNLQSLDISKNGVSEIPDSIKSCKRLSRLNISTNPICRLPEGVTQLIALRELSLNDVFLEYLPANFGRLSGLESLELRENQLNTLPRSMTRLTSLRRIDLGQNEFTEIPEVVGHLSALEELCVDGNRIRSLPSHLGALGRLAVIDAAGNRIRNVDEAIGRCLSLTHLFLSENELEELPEELCACVNLRMLDVDTNQLETLPSGLGGLQSLLELKTSHNLISYLPPSVGLLRRLHSLHIDDNTLEALPPELASCAALTILTAARNEILFLPPDLGSLGRLRVLNLAANRIPSLPVSFSKLQLKALWLSENQAKPSVPLQATTDDSGQKVLTCFMLPQSPEHDAAAARASDAACDDRPLTEAELERRRARRLIQFAADGETSGGGRLSRVPTPYPKELRALARHTKNMRDLKKEKDVSVNGENAQQIENGYKDASTSEPSPIKSLSSSVSNEAKAAFTAPVAEVVPISTKSNYESLAKEEAELKEIPNVSTNEIDSSERAINSTSEINPQTKQFNDSRNIGLKTTNQPAQPEVKTNFDTRNFETPQSSKPQTPLTGKGYKPISNGYDTGNFEIKSSVVYSARKQEVVVDEPSWREDIPEQRPPVEGTETPQPPKMSQPSYNQTNESKPFSSPPSNMYEMRAFNKHYAHMSPAESREAMRMQTSVVRPASIAIEPLMSARRPASLALEGSPPPWVAGRPGSLAAPINIIGIPPVTMRSSSQSAIAPGSETRSNGFGGNFRNFSRVTEEVLTVEPPNNADTMKVSVNSTIAVNNSVNTASNTFITPPPDTPQSEVKPRSSIPTLSSPTYRNDSQPQLSPKEISLQQPTRIHSRIPTFASPVSPQPQAPISPPISPPTSPPIFPPTRNVTPSMLPSPGSSIPVKRAVSGIPSPASVPLPSISPTQKPINQTGIPILATQPLSPAEKSSRIPTFSNTSLRGRKQGGGAASTTTRIPTKYSS